MPRGKPKANGRRANLVPALVIQAAVVSVVVAYYFWEPARAWLAGLAEFRREGGYAFSLGSGVLAGGLLPCLNTVPSPTSTPPAATTSMRRRATFGPL